MATQTSAAPSEAEAEAEAVDVESLYRMPMRIYRRISRRGLFGPGDRVGLEKGLLVREDGPDRLYRMPLKVYHAIAEQGVLTRCDKVVLLDGLLVKIMTKGAPHITVTQRIMNALNQCAIAGWYVRKEEPISLPGKPGGRDSEPEPDLALVRGQFEDYGTKHPGPGEIALVVEVAESSLRNDRKNLPILARAGIPVTWIVNLSSRTIEVSSNPTGPLEDPKYGTLQIHGIGDRVPVVIEGREVGQVIVAEILR